MEEKTEWKTIFIMIVFIALGFVILFIFFKPQLKDLAIAYTIPKYPNANVWKVTSQGNLIITLPKAFIEFSTNDTIRQVASYYDQKLVDNGWIIGETINYSYKDGIISYAGKKYSKKILTINFHLSLFWPETTNMDLSSSKIYNITIDHLSF